MNTTEKIKCPSYFNKVDKRNFVTYFLTQKEQELVNKIAEDIYPIRISFSQADKTYQNDILTITGLIAYGTPAQDGDIGFILHEIAHCLEAEDEKLYYPYGFNFYEGYEIYLPGRYARTVTIPQSNKAIRRETRVFSIEKSLCSIYGLKEDTKESANSLIDFMSNYMVDIPIELDDCSSVNEYKEYINSFFTQCILNGYNTKYSEAFVFNRLNEIKHTLLAGGISDLGAN